MGMDLWVITEEPSRDGAGRACTLWYGRHRDYRNHWHSGCGWNAGATASQVTGLTREAVEGQISGWGRGK
jgi:hypothetical protein